MRHGGRHATAGWGLVNKARSRNAAIETGFTSLVFHQRLPPSLCLSKEQSWLWLRSFHANWNSRRKSNLREGGCTGGGKLLLCTVDSSKESRFAIGGSNCQIPFLTSIKLLRPIPRSVLTISLIRRKTDQDKQMRDLHSVREKNLFVIVFF